MGMHVRRRTWQEELEIVDRTMRAISGVSDPEELVDVYWQGIGELVPVGDYVSLSRRGEESPFYLVTRASRFTEHFNPWTQRERLPRMSGGLLGELVYANRPVIIDDLPSRLAPDDPGRFYLEGYQHLLALPQYDNGEGLNVTAMLLEPGVEPDPAMIPVLHWQSGLFGRGTQNLVLRNQLASALASLDRELRIVADIQRSLLPSSLPRIEGFEFAASYQTSAQAGGDYYDFFALDGGALGMFIADVSGHGTPAAVLMAITHALAHARPGAHTPPGVLLDYLNAQLAGTYTSAGTFITAFYAVLDPASRRLRYARAGHNPPRLVRGGRVLSLEEAGALPLGIVDGPPHEESVVRLVPGDLLLLYTDGITEAMAPADPGGSRELFGVERLDALLVGCGECSTGECVERILAEVGRFSGGSARADDQTLIAIRCVPVGVAPGSERHG
ncbi:MAG: PP2C family protein-serine/threonine phosphatase [Phycisphaerales bacterium]|nr:PP2C family protein-serine/threonine phosphatase [Phycisphaerales bacterium]